MYVLLCGVRVCLQQHRRTGCVVGCCLLYSPTSGLPVLLFCFSVVLLLCPSSLGSPKLPAPSLSLHLHAPVALLSTKFLGWPQLETSFPWSKNRDTCEHQSQYLSRLLSEHEHSESDVMVEKTVKHCRFRWEVSMLLGHLRGSFLHPNRLQF
uniref:Putative transmembrane protein n=1 Tax=Toxoplasma gondii COUG TaxID=1074873 RepID=A0A2G8XU85_TOXGO|nr:putative transmembrane protein [Toxoplasma gondii COUG]